MTFVCDRKRDEPRSERTGKVLRWQLARRCLGLVLERRDCDGAPLVLLHLECLHVRAPRGTWSISAHVSFMMMLLQATIRTPDVRLSDPIVQAFNKWVFRPAQLNNQPVAVKVLLRVRGAVPPRTFRGNRHVSERNTTPLPPLDSIAGVANANAQMIGDLYAGRLEPKSATALAPLLTRQLRALGAEEQEEKFGKLEEEIKKLNEKIQHGSAEELKEPSPALVSGRANAASGFD